MRSGASWWIERPGRSLSFLEGCAAWPPAIVYGLLCCEHRLDVLDWRLTGMVSVVVIGAALVRALFRPRALAAHARALGWLWVAFLLLPLPVLTRFAWVDSPLAEVALLGASSAGLAGLAQLGIGLRARRWVTGTVRVEGEAIHLVTPRLTLVLDRVPEGARDGDPLTLPSLAIHASARGPYRSPRPAGYAPWVLRADGRRLARQLLVRGALLTAWGLATVALLASPP